MEKLNKDGTNFGWNEFFDGTNNGNEFFPIIITSRTPTPRQIMLLRVMSAK